MGNSLVMDTTRKHHFQLAGTDRGTAFLAGSICAVLIGGIAVLTHSVVASAAAGAILMIGLAVVRNMLPKR
ncbi:hypothetical protein [Nocardia heshunensis]